jgi:hypothetical protein
MENDSLLKHISEAFTYTFTSSESDKVDFKRLAAKIGYVQAMYRLGLLYHEGYEGVKKDLRKSMKWLLKAIENDYAPAMTFLGRLYARGEGVTVNKSKAIELWKKSVALGDCLGYLYLAVAYKNGDGVIRDVAEGDSLFLRCLDLVEYAKKEYLGLMTIH